MGKCDMNKRKIFSKTCVLNTSVLAIVIMAVITFIAFICSVHQRSSSANVSLNNQNYSPNNSQTTQDRSAQIIMERGNSNDQSVDKTAKSRRRNQL